VRGVAVSRATDPLAPILPKDGQDVGTHAVASSYLSEFGRRRFVRKKSKEDLEGRISTAKEGDAGLEGNMVVSAGITCPVGVARYKRYNNLLVYS
jgi:hypothetical protein